MKTLNPTDVHKFLDEKIVKLYESQIEALREIKLNTILGNRNPYFLAFSGVASVPDLIQDALDDFLFPIEQDLLGDFLKDLAVFMASKTCDGHKSTAPGVDLEFFNSGVHYVVSVKSGTNWGNSSQQKKLEEDLRNAVIRVRQSKHGANIQSILGICYGKTKTSYVRGYLKVAGQNFWYLISENEALYTDIIEPIGYRAKQHNETFLKEKSRVINRFTKQFIDKFCDDTGDIDWVKLVEFNSGNYDLDKFLS